MKYLVSLSLLILLLNSLFAQKEANVWHFGHNAGLDFNNGAPPEVLDVVYYSANPGCATICDSLGNLLFSCGTNRIWNRNGGIMLNGNNLEGRPGASQFALILKKPSSQSLYYVFTISTPNELYAPGLWYSIVDMDIDGGLGGITDQKNIPVEAAWDARDKQIGFKSGNSFKVLAYKAYEEQYAVFTIDEMGLNENPILSNSLPRIHTGIPATMKMSFDKEYLVSAFGSNNANSDDNAFEICKYNNKNDSIEVLYIIHHFGEGGTSFRWPHSVEFSPDSKFLYLITYIQKPGGDRMSLFQYDMKFIEDSALFKESEILIAEGEMGGLQLATDGKIYLGSGGGVDDNNYVGVIHAPWKRGVDCNFIEDDIFFGDEKVKEFLPNILLDYLYRFEWQGRCSAEPFVFQPNFQPEPVSIQWNFSDPGAGADSISTDLNPVHYFTHSGEFEVKVVVQYPNGRIERTSRVVKVDPSPQPDLGPDTLMCAQTELTLNAGEEEGFYLWSNGSFGQNANELLVSDTGWYWVDVTNNVDCTVRDSIHVGYFPESLINVDNLQLIPTSCGGNSGKILGIEVTGVEPFAFEWYNFDSLLMGTDIDLVDLPVGNYFLLINDGNDCITISEPFTIVDAGDIEVTEVSKKDTHCGQATGSIAIVAISGSPEDLYYSIDNGNTWQLDEPLFEDLNSGSYIIRVKNESGCEGVYENNPVFIEKVSGPQIVDISTTPETDYLSNGQINITATISEGELYYSIDNGVSYQNGNGLFNNLAAGSYLCVVKDDFGCDTSFTVKLDRIILQLIEALAGDDNTCVGNAAIVPLVVNNFTNISKFYVTLTYDTTILKCDGYFNTYEDIEDNLQVSLYQNQGKVLVSWEDVSSLALPDNTKLTELVLGAKGEGFSQVDWVSTEDESAFFNSQGDEISVDYQLGKVRVYSRPVIDMFNNWGVCEEKTLSIYPWITGGAGEVSFVWNGPNNYTSTNSSLEITGITHDQAGIYTLTVTDTVNCIESKNIDVSVNDNPTIAFADYDTLFAEPGFVLEAGGDYLFYQWNTGENTGSITINEEGLYIVEIGTQEQCFAMDSVTVLWGGESFWLPNAFSPNGDGLNDVFKPVQRYDYVNSYNLSIFSRWGELIFETSNIEQGWDGNHKGKKAPIGTYVYRIVYTAHSTGTDTQVKTGHFSLVK